MLLLLLPFRSWAVPPIPLLCVLCVLCCAVLCWAVHAAALNPAPANATVRTFETSSSPLSSTAKEQRRSALTEAQSSPICPAPQRIPDACPGPTSTWQGLARASSPRHNSRAPSQAPAGKRRAPSQPWPGRRALFFPRRHGLSGRHRLAQGPPCKGSKPALPTPRPRGRGSSEQDCSAGAPPPSFS